ncbi:hypothetical protein [Brevundimonas sp.]|uniref:hypothetical protein n=1 Tax=Brevundimonas sp. TaxID=1871086 RepID=UPI00286A5536|nr:hypothetical protein [Brevundimonas sp.]
MTRTPGRQGVKAAGTAFSALGVATSCFASYAWFDSARFNTEFKSTNFGGPAENFGPLDAMMNFVPAGGVALIGIGILVTWIAGKLRAACLLSLTQIIALVVIRPGMWIS